MIELFHQHFDKEWLDEVTALYDELIVNNIGCFKNQQFFRSPGNYRHSGAPYGGKRARHLAENEYNTHNKYLNFLVYSPSIQMLEYIIKNNITGIRGLSSLPGELQRITSHVGAPKNSLLLIMMTEYQELIAKLFLAGSNMLYQIFFVFF